MCHACGGGIQLLVNSASVGFHLPTDEVGSNSYRTEPGDSTRLNYLSMVVSKQTTNGSTCLDVLLIVTQAKSEYDEGSPLNIVCRSSTQEFQIPYQRSQRRITAIANNTVFLSHIIGTNLVTGNENLVTNIFLCSTNESSMSWRRNRQPVGAFNGLHTAGDDEQVLHKNDSSVLFLETILLAKRAGDITSLLLLTDFNSSMNSTISCTSNLNFIVISQNDSYVSNEDASQVTTMVQDIQETTTNMIITNTDKENTDEGNMDNGNTSTEKNAGLESKLYTNHVVMLVNVTLLPFSFRLGSCSGQYGSIIISDCHDNSYYKYHLHCCTVQEDEVNKSLLLHKA